MKKNTRYSIVENKQVQTSAKIEHLLKDLTCEEIANIPMIAAVWLEKKKDLQRFYMAKYSSRKSQIEMCHAWLLLFEHRALNLLIGKNKWITKSQFHVLMAAFVMLRMKQNFFKVSEMQKYLLKWQYTRIYKHLRKLLEIGLISKQELGSRFHKPSRYSITLEGIRVIHAFSQYFIECFRDFEEGFGKLPDRFKESWLRSFTT